MTNTKTIEISITLNAFIEQNRKNFSEDANDILCRLLGIAQPLSHQKNISDQEEIEGWTSKGVTFKNGTLLRMIYNDQKFYGKIVKGKLTVCNKQYKSLSAAACDLARTQNNTRTSLSGWGLFEYRYSENEEWRPVWELRK
jgi:hypothetical protein